jgi:hypothetical protein
MKSENALAGPCHFEPCHFEMETLKTQDRKRVGFDVSDSRTWRRAVSCKCETIVVQLVQSSRLRGVIRVGLSFDFQ